MPISPLKEARTNNSRLKPGEKVRLEEAFMSDYILAFRKLRAEPSRKLESSGANLLLKEVIHKLEGCRPEYRNEQGREKKQSERNE